MENDYSRIGVDFYHAFDIIKTEGIIIDNPLVRY